MEYNATLGTSSKLLRDIKNAEWWSQFYIYAAFAFFLAVVIYILQKRLHVPGFIGLIVYFVKLITSFISYILKLPFGGEKTVDTVLNATVTNSTTN